jgi:hypothetical protein
MKRVASPSDETGIKEEVARRKRAIREKYVKRSAQTRQEGFLSALKVAFYALGGPLVWIFWSISKKK